MKKIREYHIEHYWQAEAVRREKRAEFKEKLVKRIMLAALFALYGFIGWELMRQIFEVI